LSDGVFVCWVHAYALGDLISGLPAGDDGTKENIERPSMLYLQSCNRNGDKADGIFGRDSGRRVSS